MGDTFPELINITEAARYLNRSRSWLERQTRGNAPKIPFYRVGGSRYFLLADLLAYLNKHRIEKYRRDPDTNVSGNHGVSV